MGASVVAAGSDSNTRTFFCCVQLTLQFSFKLAKKKKRKLAARAVEQLYSGIYQMVNLVYSLADLVYHLMNS